MKRRHTIVGLLLCLFVVACYDKDIDGINGQIAVIENDKIATLQEQVAAIDKTLPELENADKKLNDYITSLQSTATKLEEEITVAEENIITVKEALEKAVKDAEASNSALAEQLNSTKTTILAQLENTKTEVSQELEKINSTIDTMQTKDKALEKLIDELREYTNGELQKTKNWAEGTFATIEQYNTLATEIATIKENITAQNNAITALENKLTNSINSNIEQALKTVDANIQEEVSAITTAYTKAVSDAKNNITTAYTKAISEAITGIESSMKSWVNEQFAGYYTIAEVDAKLDILNNTCATKENLQSEITNMANSLNQAKSDITAAYTKAIEDAIGNSGIISEKVEEAIQNANTNMTNRVSTIESKISIIEGRLDKVENDIANINTQITNINTTIESLRATENELDGYIKTLQSTASNLQKAIDETNGKIDELDEELSEEITIAKAEMLAELAELRTELENELAVINSAITTLQAKDAKLEKDITDLQSFVQNELNSTKEWTTATFATLAQYNSLADEVTVIKGQIQTINNNISQLETRLNNKIKTDIASAVSTLNSTIQQKVTEITNAYTNAISKAKTEITAAYTEAIDVAIFSLEMSMQTWVNDRLSNYYTIAQVDAMLGSLEQTFNSKLETQKTYLTGLINSLSTDLNNKITSNKNLIATLRSDVNTLFGKDTELAQSISDNATAIAKNASDINNNALSISNNSNSIAENGTRITENNRLIEVNSRLISENDAAIKALSKSTNEAVQELLSKINKNAEDIATNATLIAKNATAINNNAEAIAQNVADIQQLRQDLATAKSEITEAYKAAIKTAIETLDGALRDEISTQVDNINTRIDNEVATVNSTISALDARVTALEKEVKNIKVAIYSIQTEIADMQEQIAAIIARIQSVSFVPEYSDGKATMFYTNSAGTITAGSATLRYEVRPAEVAEEIAAVWEEALSIKAVYTKTRAVAGEFVSLNVESATADEGILSVVVSGANFDEAFFRSEIQANIRLEISNGYNCLTSGYTQIIPWTTDVVYIPDNNFKAYLVGEFDTNSDGEISLAEAEEVKEINIAASLLQVKSMAGIEYFTNLETLDCSFNRVTTLDLANNSKLTSVNVSNNKLTSLTLPASVVTVDASNNQLTALEVSNATALTSLNINNNKLTTLNVGQSKALQTLKCNDNDLVALDVTKLISLTELACGGNNIPTLDVTKNTLLTALNCHGNTLTVLDLAKNTALTTLDCGENAIATIYLGTEKLASLDCANNALTSINVALQTKLAEFDCSHNKLTQLDVTKCTKLATFDCSYNNLAMLNISNNSMLTTLDCSNNASLAKLWVKDDAQQGAVAITKDNTTTTYFNNGGIVIPDAALKAYLVNNYDDDGDGDISIAESDNITMVNCSGKGVTDLTGLEACTNLETLNCSNNSIKKIELPNLAKLKTITCNDCPIELMIFNGCTSLQYLNLQGVTTNAIIGNKLQIMDYNQASLTIDVSHTTLNQISVCRSEILTHLDVSKNTHLKVLKAYVNPNLKSIDVSNLVNLEFLDLGDCGVTNLDISKNLMLTELYVNNNKLSAIDVSQNKELKILKCNKNQISKLNISNNDKLETLIVEDNKLSAINVRNNTALTNLNINNNAEISMVDVKTNKALTNLYCNGLAIGELNIANNTALTKLECHSNPNLTTLTCNDAFDFTTTHISINKGLDILSASGSVLTPSIGDLITVNLCKGVVFSASNGSFKIVSVDETKLAWGSWNATSATDKNNGVNNMTKIKALADWETKYPAFKWCSDYGKDWYLPARNELIAIIDNQSTINSTLSANGYTILGSDDYTGFYWSSTERNSSEAYASHCNGNSGEDEKQYKFAVRAILAF